MPAPRVRRCGFPSSSTGGDTRTRALVAAALLFGGEAAAQADTLSPRPFFTWRDAAILEAFAIATVAIAPLDRKFARRLQDPDLQTNRWMRNTSEFVETVADPGAALIGIGIYTYGRLTGNVYAADLGLHGLEAMGIGYAIGTVMKGIVGRARPYIDVEQPHDYELFRGFGGGSDYRAFPSGHSISAFAAAAAVTSELRRWSPQSFWFVAPFLYGGATVVAWSRMFDNKHWASDVITGAAIGTFTGLKVVQWHHTHPGNFIDRNLISPVVSRSADGGALIGVRIATSF